MASDSLPSPPVNETETSIIREIPRSPSQTSSAALPATLPGAYPSSLSLASAHTSTETAIPPLAALSDPHLPAPAQYGSAPTQPAADPRGLQLPTPPRPRPRRRSRASFIRRVFVFFGYGDGNRARKQLVSFLWTLSIDVLQILAIIILLSLATHTVSPTLPPQNEWDACRKPLGAWNAIWTVRTAVDLLLSYYHWSQQRRKRLNATAVADVGHVYNGERYQAQPTSPRRTTSAEQYQNGGGQGPADRPSSIYPAWYGRLSALCTTFTIVWFVMAHIFLYTSTDTCRFSSPYIWWLTFAILSIMYIAVAEVVVIALVVFIIGPLVALIFTVALLIMGRHPLQNPHQIKPDIEAMSRSLVDSIPLVVYIPPPPDEPSSGPITIPPEALSYPPKPKTTPPATKKPRFRWLRIKKKAASKGEKMGAGGEGEKHAENEDQDEDQPRVWEDNWEKGEYPFVRLEDNRASCAICLLDFEEPKRRFPPAKSLDDSGNVGDAQLTESAVTETATPSSALDPSVLRLEDVGDGVQPLRLLACGHVFHQTCLDPWLTGVSGRCPTCQRAVELPPEPTRRKGRRRRDRSPPRTP